MDRPLATFALFTYNQEDYIREAFQGAVDQLYEPLEIIISDDCSTDKTYAILTELSKAYTGKHKLLIRRTENNLGIFKHVSQIHSIANGTYIVHAAGDDISLPERVSVIVSFFQNSPGNLQLIQTNGLTINKMGQETGVLSHKNSTEVYGGVKNSLRFPAHGPLGCTLAIKKSLTEKFKQPQEKIIAEDVLLFRRACLVGCAAYIPNILVKYRVGVGISNYVSSSEVLLTTRKRMMSDRLVRLEQFILDAEEVGVVLTAEQRQEFKKQTKSTRLMSRALDKQSILIAIRALWFVKTRECLFLTHLILKTKIKNPPRLFNLGR